MTKSKGLSPGDKVLINADPTGSSPQWTISATVVDTLSVQFTAAYDLNDALTFQFYADEEITWRKA